MNFKKYNQDQKERRESRLSGRKGDLFTLTECTIAELPQRGGYRINGFLDINLVHNTYSDIKRHETGFFKVPASMFVREYLARVPLTNFETTMYPLPDPPKFHFLFFRPKLRKFLHHLQSFRSVYEAQQTPMVNTRTAMGQALFKALSKKH